MARPAGLEPATPGLAYHYGFRRPHSKHGVCGLDYLFTVSGAARIVSTDPVGEPDTLSIRGGFHGIAIGTTR